MLHKLQKQTHTHTKTFSHSVKSKYIDLRCKLYIRSLVFWEIEQNEMSLCFKQEQISASGVWKHVFPLN